MAFLFEIFFRRRRRHKRAESDAPASFPSSSPRRQQLGGEDRWHSRTQSETTGNSSIRSIFSDEIEAKDPKRAMGAPSARTSAYGHAYLNTSLAGPRTPLLVPSPTPDPSGGHQLSEQSPRGRPISSFATLDNVGRAEKRAVVWTESMAPQPFSGDRWTLDRNSIVADEDDDEEERVQNEIEAGAKRRRAQELQDMKALEHGWSRHSPHRVSQ